MEPCHGAMPCRSRARPSGTHGGPNHYESGGTTFFVDGKGLVQVGREKLKGDVIFKHGPHGPSVFGCPNLDPHLYDAKCVSDPGR